MKHWKLTQWCLYATNRIQFPPDRKAARVELRQHLDDRCEDLMAKGLTAEEAVDEAIRLMGDPGVVSRMLVQVHRPFWGWAYWTARALMVALLIITSVQIIFWAWQKTADLQPTAESLVYTQASRENSIRTRYLEPNVSASMDGYTFTVTNIAQWHHNNTDNDTFHLRIQVINPRPWAEDCMAVDWFWAEDNLGNYYFSENEGMSSEGMTSNVSYLAGNVAQTGFFTQTYDLWLSRFKSENAQWLDLRYTRNGRDLSLRIDLTGGVG